MKRYLLTIFLMAMLCGSASAQAEFISGYIIKNDGSITSGLVKYIPKDHTVKECVFKLLEISSGSVYLPGEIEAFGYTPGMRYKTVGYKGRKIFMACLTDGELDLLFDGDRMYLNGMGLDMVALGNNAGNVTVDGLTVSYNGFRDLIEKLPDPENKFTVPDDISLDPVKMTEVISAYNESRGFRAAVFSMKKPERIYEEMRNLGNYMGNYGILAGMNASQYYAEKSSNTVRLFIPKMDFFEISPVIGFWYNRPLSRESDLFSLQGEVLAFRTKVYIYDETVYSTSTTRSDINFTYTGIKVPLSLRVSILKGSFKPFMSLGGFGMVNLGSKYTREGETENSYHVVRPFTDNTLLLNQTMFGGLAGIGIKKEFSPKKSFTIEFRAEYGSGIYDSKSIDQHTLSFNIFAGFDFL